MSRKSSSPAVRRPLRSALRAAAVGLGGAAVTLAAPAAATPPDSWAESDPVSPMDFLLVIAIIPLGLAALIALLALLPSMTRAESSYQPGLAWRNEPEWFGGRREVKGDEEQAKAIAEGTSEDARERGGASARW